jgi:hypothetical protein
MHHAKISIDFVGGTHGNFLEYILNRLVLGDKIHLDNLFTELGTSHNKTWEYYQKRIVEAHHYTVRHLDTLDNIISIRYNEDDLLGLMSCSLYRSGDFKINDNFLHVDTYNKLSGDYTFLIEEINQSYDVKLSANNPDCPRYILREFFKFAFKDPSISGFMRIQNNISYPPHKKVFYFPLTSFYDINKLKESLCEIKDFFNLPEFVEFNLESLHRPFLEKMQPFLVLKKQADNLIFDVTQKKHRPIESLTLFQESYINGILEKKYNIEMPFIQEHYFKNTSEIIEHLKL